MTQAVGYIVFALCVMSVAYCTIHIDQSGKDYSAKKAEICIDAGGRYDFNWSSCSYE